MDSYNIFIALCLAISGTVYSSILTEQNQIFNWLYRLLDRLPDWLSYPLIVCHKCVTGQMALWAFAILFLNKYILLFYSPEIVPIFKLLFTHVFLICISILFSCLINKLYQLTR